MPRLLKKYAVMAAQQLYDYLENGNIVNSVNLPSINLERVGASRMCVIHKNVPRMITSFLEQISGLDVNVEHMINKSKGISHIRS